jgi:phosphoglucan,water dikinase
MAEKLVQRLARADAANGSWRKKLIWVRDLLAERDFAAENRAEKLAVIATYLRFLGTGQHACAEDGGHYRPSHHAKLSREINEALAEIANRASDDDTDRDESVSEATRLSLVLRKIYPWLPSYDSAFTRTEPLTRIRDIAHRNDIPQALKREIKHTLQNKLHRCADPKDLLTARALLARITTPGADYSRPFVEQFRIFHRELEQFFGQADLEAQLQEVVSSGGTRSALADRVLSLHRDLQALEMPGGTTVDKTRSEAERDEEIALCLALLAESVSLRGLCGVANSDASEFGRRMRILDQSLEKLAFTASSRCINRLQAIASQGSAAFVAHYVPRALHLVGLLLANLVLSGFEDAARLTSELSNRPAESDKDALIWLRAFLQRVRLLLAEHTDRLTELFSVPAATLGEALGVSPQAIATFIEGDIRGNLAFQLSRAIDDIYGRVRAQLGLSAWMPVVLGNASGKLVRKDALRSVSSDPVSSDQGQIMLLESASGDEDLPKGVAGVLLLHAIPQLSHLGVRARQAGVPFACADDGNAVAGIESFVGKQVLLQVSESDARLDATSETDAHVAFSEQQAAKRNESDQTGPAPAVPGIEIELTETPLAVGEARIATCGAKAASAGVLERLAARADFRTPASLALPYGVMTRALRTIEGERRYEALARALVDRTLDEAQREQTSKQLSDLLARLEVPQNALDAARSAFAEESRLMVRSSSSVEDLATEAGAGLYDSIANVPLGQLDTAIKEVWQSLFTERAIASRRRAGLADPPWMGVLLQQLVAPDYAFILHSKDPFDPGGDQVLVEICVGHGEALASAKISGTPFRLRVHADGHAETTALASFTEALWPDEALGLKKAPINYADIRLATDGAFRAELGARLGHIAKAVAAELGAPQDIEGVIRDGDIYLVQTRPQQGLASRSGALRADVGDSNASDSNASDSNPSFGDAPPAFSCHAGTPREGDATPPSTGKNMTTALPPSVLMPHRPPPSVLPPIYGLFEKQVAGDDALYELARRRFSAVGLGAEFHTGNHGQLEQIWRYAPTADAMLHLPRGLDLLDEGLHELVIAFAARFAGRLRGMVMHDQLELVNKADSYRQAAHSLDRRLARIERGPKLFIEYAVGLDPHEFLGFFQGAPEQGWSRLGACVDTGHVGIWQARHHFAKRHDGLDVCSLTPYDPRLPKLIDEVDAAARSALPRILELLALLSKTKLPLHMHLHDGHPLWTYSPHRVSDHMSFLEEISIPFEFQGRRAVTPLYGPAGLERVVCAAMQYFGADNVSLTIEIHPMTGQEPLTPENEEIFAKWRDRTNAMRMNYWISILLANFALLQDIVSRCRSQQ